MPTDGGCKHSQGGHSHAKCNGVVGSYAGHMFIFRDDQLATPDSFQQRRTLLDSAGILKHEPMFSRLYVCLGAWCLLSKQLNLALFPFMTLNNPYRPSKRGGKLDHGASRGLLSIVKTGGTCCSYFQLYRTVITHRIKSCLNIGSNARLFRRTPIQMENWSLYPKWHYALVMFIQMMWSTTTVNLGPYL